MDDDLSGFLSQVDKIDALVRGIKEGDESAIQEADSMLAKQEKEAREGSVKAERTVINKAPAVAQGPQLSPEEQGQEAFMRSLRVDAEERAARRRVGRKTAEELKDKGNAAFNKGCFEQALEHYSAALLESPDYLPLYTNRAQTFLKLGRPKDALEDCEWALRLDPRCTKALLRRGLAHQALASFPEAIEAFSAARKTVLQPERATFDAHIEETQRLQAVHEAEQRALAAAAAAAPSAPADDPAPPAIAAAEFPIGDPVRLVDAVLPALLPPALPPPERVQQLLELLASHALDTDVAKDLFRLRGGLRLLETHAGSEKPALVSALLHLLHKACKGSEANQRAVVESANARAALGGCLCSPHEVVVSSALFLLALLADTEAARKVLATDLQLELIEPCVAVMEAASASTRGFAVGTRTQAALFLAIFAVCPELHKRCLAAFSANLFGRLRRLLDRCTASRERPLSEAAQILNVLLHFSADTKLRDCMGRKENTRGFVKDAYALLVGLKEGLADAPVALEALLALLSNLGLQGDALRVLEDPGLADTLADLIGVANTLALRLRTVGLLARICNKEALAERLVDNGGMKRLLQLARQSKDGPTLEVVSRALAKGARGSERARAAMGTDKAMRALVDLLAMQAPAVAGNAALCIAECARSPEVC
jgi:hypothetical protein